MCGVVVVLVVWRFTTQGPGIVATHRRGHGAEGRQGGDGKEDGRGEEEGRGIKR